MPFHKRRQSTRRRRLYTSSVLTIRESTIRGLNCLDKNTIEMLTIYADWHRDINENQDEHNTRPWSSVQSRKGGDMLNGVHTFMHMPSRDMQFAALCKSGDKNRWLQECIWVQVKAIGWIMSMHTIKGWSFKVGRVSHATLRLRHFKQLFNREMHDYKPLFVRDSGRRGINLVYILARGIIYNSWWRIFINANMQSKFIPDSHRDSKVKVDRKGIRWQRYFS